MEDDELMSRTNFVFKEPEQLPLEANANAIIIATSAALNEIKQKKNFKSNLKRKVESIVGDELVVENDGEILTDNVTPIVKARKINNKF